MVTVKPPLSTIAKSAETLLAGEKRSLEMIARSDSQQGVLAALCGLVEATTEGAFCSIMPEAPNDKQLQHSSADDHEVFGGAVYNCLLGLDPAERRNGYDGAD